MFGNQYVKILEVALKYIFGTQTVIQIMQLKVIYRDLSFHFLSNDKHY